MENLCRLMTFHILNILPHTLHWMWSGKSGDVLCPKYSLNLPPNSHQHGTVQPIMVIIWMTSQSSQLLLLTTACYNY